MLLRHTAGQHWRPALKQTLPVGCCGFAGMSGEAAARKPFEITAVIRIPANMLVAVVAKQDLLSAEASIYKACLNFFMSNFSLVEQTITSPAL